MRKSNSFWINTVSKSAYDCLNKSKQHEEDNFFMKKVKLPKNNDDPLDRLQYNEINSFHKIAKLHQQSPNVKTDILDLETKQANINKILLKNVILSKLKKKYKSTLSQKKSFSYHQTSNKINKMLGETIDVFKTLKKQRKHGSLTNFESISKELIDEDLKNRLKAEIYSQGQRGEAGENDKMIREEKERKIVQDGIEFFHCELYKTNKKRKETNGIINEIKKKMYEKEKIIGTLIWEKKNILKNFIVTEEAKKDDKKILQTGKTLRANVIDDFMKMQVLKIDKEQKINSISEKIQKENKIFELIKIELNNKTLYLKELELKKQFMKNSLKQIYLQILKNYKLIDNYNGNLSDTIIALWNLKISISVDDFPNFLDLKSKQYIIENAKLIQQFTNTKEKDKTDILQQIEKLKLQEKNRIFQLKMKETMNMHDFKILKDSLLYMFGRNHCNNIYMEFLSEKRLFEQKIKKNKTFSFLPGTLSFMQSDCEKCYKASILISKQDKIGYKKSNSDRGLYEEAFNWTKSLDHKINNINNE